MRACSLSALVPLGSRPARPANALMASGPYLRAISLTSAVALFGTPGFLPAPGIRPPLPAMVDMHRLFFAYATTVTPCRLQRTWAESVTQTKLMFSPGLPLRGLGKVACAKLVPGANTTCGPTLI